MNIAKDKATSFDIAALFERHFAKLQSIALKWLHGSPGDAGDAVQNTFRIALENLRDIPQNAAEAERWLVSILKDRVLAVMPRQHLRDDRPRAKFSFVPKRERGDTGSGQHYLAQSAEDSANAKTEYDSVLDELSREERELLFCNTTADWTGQWRQAQFRQFLKAKVEPVPFTAASRLLQFVREHASPRSMEDYLSTFRVLERRYGKALRVSDLNAELYRRYVVPLPCGTRKRILSVWNSAARLGLTCQPPDFRRPLTTNHPAFWTTEKLHGFLDRALLLRGNVYRTTVTQCEYWPALVFLAADARLAIISLLDLSW